MPITKQRAIDIAPGVKVVNKYLDQHVPSLFRGSISNDMVTTIVDEAVTAIDADRAKKVPTPPVPPPATKPQETPHA